jgi:hypothetical protein
MHAQMPVLTFQTADHPRADLQMEQVRVTAAKVVGVTDGALHKMSIRTMIERGRSTITRARVARRSKYSLVNRGGTSVVVCQLSRRA